MENQYKFQKMTPYDGVDMGIYERAMEYIFANDDIRNIAVSGAYGAGKSSVIESYKKVCPDKKFLHISLAHFQEKESENESGADVLSSDETKAERVAALEEKIINQLVHQIDSRNIPLTNFKIKKDVSVWQILEPTILAVLFIAIMCFLRFNSAWVNMVNSFRTDWLRQFLNFTTSTEMELLLGGAGLLILFYAIFRLLLLQKHGKLFRKISFQGNEIEMSEETQVSYFDQHLFEILYIFRHAEVDGFVFEDIDRHDTTLIFEKLREINFLLNKNRACEQTVRFFYLLRDDLFESKDRTKFFDFILPIVPVVDASNAYDQFIKYFKEAQLLQLFDMDFLQGLSLYVDDMRILKNICNEFIVYHERLKTPFSVQSNNKLLAMVTYKNLFPKDFGSLQLGRGYVYTLFAQKKDFIRDKKERLEQELDRLKTENDRMNSELCKDLDELNALYFVINGDITVDGKPETAYSSRKEFVKALLKSSDIKRKEYVYGYSNGKWVPINIDAEKQAMEQNPDYIERKKVIERRVKNKVNRDNNQIKNLQTQIDELNDIYLKDIITRENETLFFAVNYSNAIGETEVFEEVKGSPYFDLIKFLVRNGYLDETYPDYMTYFYANSITANDKTFLRGVTDKHAQPYDYALDNAALVVSRMRVVDFKEEEALNYRLLEQLLSNPKLYQEQLRNFLYLIWNIEPVEFVNRFLERSSVRRIFVNVMNDAWGNACDWVLTTDGFTEQNRKVYVVDTLHTASDKQLTAYNQDDVIKHFIDSDAGFLSIHDMDEKTLERKLKLLKIKFKNIDFEAANERLLRFVYENHMYEINMEMIFKFLERYYNLEEAEDVLSQNLTIIRSREKEPLYEYVTGTRNINLYLENLLELTEETKDTENVVIYVLNCGHIADKNKNKYLKSSKTIIHQLLKIHDTKWWSEVLAQDKAEKTTDNLCNYFYSSGNGMDTQLVRYINSFEKTPAFADIDLDKEYGKNVAENLFLAIMCNNGIDNDKYKAMLCALNRFCHRLDNSDIAPEKMAILIDGDMLEMNVDILATMRKHYPQHCLPFIRKNIEKYVEIMDATVFSSAELLWLLETDIEDELKLKLLEFASDPISIQKKKYSAQIQDYIVENLYDSKDLEHLLGWYPEGRDHMRSLILNLVEENPKDVELLKYIMHPALLSDILESDNIDLSDKKILLASQMVHGMRKANARAALNTIGLPQFNRILDGQQDKLKDTPSNEAILLAFKQRNWIAGYEKDQEDPDYFLIQKAIYRKKKTPLTPIS